ncbi:MAG: aldehyde dehydrogenase family protein, partial [Planctomycetota bacterium]|nr:aldehyde dehydrogenase family protein [Planctomycetota bacterium]
MNDTIQTSELLRSCGLADHPRLSPPGTAGTCDSLDPGTGRTTAAVRLDDGDGYDRAVLAARAVQDEWAMLPAPKRGELVRRIGNAFRERIEPLGELVSLESGKIRAEGIGELQECVDIADFAVGLSRQLHGMTTHSERPLHRMYEQWHPLGTVGIITAFNFPAAVWAWNAMLAAVCGDTMLWKPSLIAPLTAVAMNDVAREVMAEQTLFTPSNGDPRDVFGLVIGTDEEVG